jgi:hypothetical protein
VRIGTLVAAEVVENAAAGDEAGMEGTVSATRRFNRSSRNGNTIDKRPASGAFDVPIKGYNCFRP